ncbi:MAG TPA: prepilin-type N-terminal cleavage/methylation domain-containing protein [Casimicrobiaceae bacterium]|nr:prepilin-type N-terminal cleavage/methylation domain-containing protein [Casimicrobiaceae bacterium]
MRRHKRVRGFTLLELAIALTLFALMASVLYGALGFAGRSFEAGQAKSDATAGMRLSHEFLRAQLEAQHPARMRKVAEFPLLFAGTADEIRFAAPLPARITGGGIWYYRLAVVNENDTSRLVLERMLPDLDAPSIPEFDKGERSILADDVKSLRVSYFGYDAGADARTAQPSWKENWADANRLPLVIRIDIVPATGPAWPTLVVSPRQALESGCRQWDGGTERCVGMS